MTGSLAEIGRRFAEARSARGLTLRDVQASTGLSNAFVCQIENGRCRVSLDRAAKLAALYRVTLDWLATGLNG